MKEIFLYLILLLSYLPGLVALLKFEKIRQFPILVFMFLGQIIFSIVGSFSVFHDKKIYILLFDTFPVSEQLTYLLLIQVFVFYLFAIPYIKLRTPKKSYYVEPATFDKYFIGMGLISIFVLGYLYYQQTGTFMLLESLRGKMNVYNTYDLRMKYYYNLPNWPFYNLAFSMLPILLVIYISIRAYFLKKFDVLFYITSIVSCTSTMSSGSKAGLSIYLFILIITYLNIAFYTKLPFTKFRLDKIQLGCISVCLGTLVVGYIWQTPEGISPFQLLERLWYRIFVAYPEAIAGAISYTKNYDFFGITTFTNIRGLLAHKQANLSLILHQYIAGVPGGANLPLAGEGFISFGWISAFLLSYIVMTAILFIQEFSFQIKMGVFSLVFVTYYSYQAMLISAVGAFSTLFTFMYPLTIGLLFLISLALSKIHDLYFKKPGIQQ